MFRLVRKLPEANRALKETKPMFYRGGPCGFIKYAVEVQMTPEEVYKEADYSAKRGLTSKRVAKLLKIAFINQQKKSEGRYLWRWQRASEAEALHYERMKKGRAMRP